MAVTVGNQFARPRRKPVTNFTRVMNLEFKKEGEVAERLSKQFTVNYDDGSFGFLFYADKGDTWQPLDQPKKDEDKITGWPDEYTTGKSSFANWIVKDLQKAALNQQQLEADMMLMQEVFDAE